MDSISIISPSRNCLEYLRYSYNSVRKWEGYSPEYCVADDFSNDGTFEWCRDTSKKDINFKYIRNNGPKRQGHCIYYDLLIENEATGNVILIWHSDMIMSKDMVHNMLKHLKPGVVVSGTRIEPPIHPSDRSKIQKDFGMEPENFDYLKFNTYTEQLRLQNEDKTTKGFFAPWLMYKKDFLNINGHDPLYKPQSREDTDIAVRFLLNGYKLIQSRDAFCYHFTMRGSRRNPLLTNTLQDSQEWTVHNKKSERNFIRKWGYFPQHDNSMKPILKHKYNIGAVIHNCNEILIEHLEPWFDTIYADCDFKQYIEQEQLNTMYDLRKRIRTINDDVDNNIIVKFDGERLTLYGFNTVIKNFSDIITEADSVGQFNLDIFDIQIKSLQTYEQELIMADKSGKLR